MDGIGWALYERRTLNKDWRISKCSSSLDIHLFIILKSKKPLDGGFLSVARDPDIRWRIVGTGSIEPPEFIPTQVSGRGFSEPVHPLYSKA